MIVVFKQKTHGAIMKKYFLLILFAGYSNSAFANEKWTCSVDVNKGSKIKIEANVYVGQDSTLNIYYKNDFAPNNTEVAQIPLSYISENFYQNVVGDSCSDQYYGITEHSLDFSNKTNAATYTYSWCDDDGGSGFESYNLTCEKIK